MNVLLDCDPGIDDGVAILFAALSGRIHIRAITTVSGNLTSDKCSVNARKILTVLKRRYPEIASIPVARGPLKPLIRPYPRDPFSHGVDGLGDIGRMSLSLFR